MTKTYLISLLLGCLSILLISACTEPEETPAGNIAIEEAFPNLSFKRPVDFQSPADGTNRIFVIEQRGIISVFPNQADVSEKSAFLDIEGRVDDAGNEEGLLGLAFHPNYAQNGYFYVNYTANNPDETRISRFSVDPADSQQADPASEKILLTFPQPYGNHNGGGMAFGPDGFLYIATGDGGSGGDPEGNSQNRTTLLGNILRIDIDNGDPYSIPADNPFVGNQEGYKEEIYAYGLRNPWRISFDRETGKLWTGDVGQNKYEEIDIIENGGNYGWNIREAAHCYSSILGCETDGLIEPVWEYGRDQGQSITGGFVYHGSLAPSLTGQYIYADYASNRLWALDVSQALQPVNTLLARENRLKIASFGEDAQGELYMCSFDGKIYKMRE